MDTQKERLQLNIADYSDSGLYLITKENRTITFTKKAIERLAEKFWNDSSKLDQKIKKGLGFQRCRYCSEEDGSMCDAIRPIFPLLEHIQSFFSADEVTAIYRDVDEDIVIVSDTDMQSALRYLSILSLVHYCRKAASFSKYFKGVNPLSEVKDIVRKIYLNIFWLNGGNVEDTSKAIDEFKEVLFETSQNQVRRLNLVVEEDALKNAYAATQVISEMLAMNMDKKLFDYFAK